jgi:hypothetical protein
VSSGGKASVRQLELPLGTPGDEAIAGTRGEDAPVEEKNLLERMLEAQNLRRALHQVRRHQGAPGVDGMTVDGLGEYLKTHWPMIRAALLEGTYAPQPVRRMAIPKPGGGTRNLGIPTVLDRFIEQALLQVLQAEWDPTFSERSGSFRPQRSAHQAVGQAQAYTREGYTWVVDIDLEKFFDQVNHDVLMSRVRQRVQDRRVVSLIHRFLKAGVVTLEGSVEPTAEGTPQGGPTTPPTMLQTFFFEAEISRMLIDPEDHMHLVVVHFHPLHQGADHLASAGPIRFLQPVSHLRSKVFQSADDQLQLYVQGGFIHKLLGLFFQFCHPLSEVRDPRLELTLLNEPFGVTVDQPCQALP